MKKTKRPIQWEENEDDFSDQLTGESEKTVMGSFGQAGTDFVDLDEDEIIDLEDVIELPDRAREVEELNLDVELLDAEPDLDDAGDLYAAKSFEREKGPVFGDDLLKGFALAEEESLQVDPLAGIGGGFESLPKAPEVPSREPGDDALFGDESAGTRKHEPIIGSESAFPEEGGLLTSDMPFTGDLEATKKASFESALPQEPERIERAPFVGEAGSDDPAVKAEVLDQAPSMDEFVSRIESRLLAAVREIVESKLPEIVKSVLQEEIDRLKKELL